MLMSLWRHREQHAFLSSEWARAWAKRFWNLPSVLGCEVRAFNLRRRGAHIGDDVFLSPANIAGTLSKFSVGDESFVGRVMIQVHDQVNIGRCVCINDGATILSASHHVDDPEWSSFSKPVIIEDHVWIAVGAMILPGVRIGTGAVVGAGAVVSSDIPSYAVAIGNPARVKEGRRNRSLDYSPVASLASYRAWRGIEAKAARSVSALAAKTDS
jgi:acetyltransferase-like isoleucine patch superfamily enzyme